jgi:hypothetical protein
MSSTIEVPRLIRTTPDRSYGLVPGVQTARAENAAVQYFARLFGETSGEGRRVVYAELLWDEEKALNLLGTLRFDGKLSEAVFGDRLRMYRDFLADGARVAIDEILAREQAAGDEARSGARKWRKRRRISVAPADAARSPPGR